MTAIQPVLSALANPLCRDLWARIVLEEFSAPATRKQEKALERLVQAGLVVCDPSDVRDHDGHPVWRDAGVFQELLRQQSVPASGIEARYIRNGSVDHWPSKEEDKLELVRWILDRALEHGEQVPEQELNQRIRRWCQDPALVRRYGVDGGLLRRDPLTQVYARAAE